MRITAKYASTCPGCGQQIHVNQTVEWSRGQPARCLSCASESASKPATIYRNGDFARASIAADNERFWQQQESRYGSGVRPLGLGSRCPNPSNCGDPTCNGDCGY
jgi:hypothetical protein